MNSESILNFEFLRKLVPADKPPSNFGLAKAERAAAWRRLKARLLSFAYLRKLRPAVTTPPLRHSEERSDEGISFPQANSKFKIQNSKLHLLVACLVARPVYGNEIATSRPVAAPRNDAVGCNGQSAERIRRTILHLNRRSADNDRKRKDRPSHSPPRGRGRGGGVSNCKCGHRPQEQRSKARCGSWTSSPSAAAAN